VGRTSYRRRDNFVVLLGFSLVKQYSFLHGLQLKKTTLRHQMHHGNARLLSEGMKIGLPHWLCTIIYY
jgi:hypothetical protein